ncbi:MAG: TonB-dependent receptor [Cytophagales bacterium]|nr:TonB-dependent receptor [Cytophagales bacterium]
MLLIKPIEEKANVRGNLKLFLLSLTIFGLLDVAAQSKLIRIGRPSPYAPESVTLKGQIVDVSGEPLESVVVLVNGANKAASTTADGRFEFKFPPGPYTLVFHRIGLKRLIKVVEIFKDGSVVIEMQDNTINLDEVTISGNTDENVTGVTAGVSRMSIEEIERLPAFLGEVDVVKSLQLLPGVSTVGEGAGGFNVRGGKTDQNLILLNDGMIFNASHVLGFFSAFNPGVVEDFSLYKGFIPAQFGGRISSVLQVNMKEGNDEKLKFDGGIGIISSRMVIDGPINDKTTFVLGGRASYSDWVLRTVQNLDVKNSDASFSDLNAIINHKFNNEHNVQLSYYRSRDFFRFSDQFGFDWGTDLFAAKYDGVLNPSLKTETSVSQGFYNSSRFDPEGIDAASVKNGVEYFQARQNFIVTPAALDQHTFNVGAQYVQYRIKPESSRPQTPESGIVPETVEKERGREYSLYINDEIEFTDRITLSLGLRYTLFQNYGPYTVFQYSDPNAPSIPTLTDTLQFSTGDLIKTYDGFEPRAALKFQLSPQSSIKMSYNRMNQYIHTVSNTTAQSPVDLWQPSNRYIPPQISDNFSIGYFQNLNDNQWEFSFDLFYKDSENLLEYKDFANLILNNHLETDLLSGQGRAYGSEVQIKRNYGKWSGWVSYTYSRTMVKIDNANPELTINRGEWYPTNFDRPHNLAVVSKLKMGQKSSFDANFNFTSGIPTNAIITAYQVDQQAVPHFSDRNEFRIPDYVRLDLAITVADNIWKFERKKPKRYEESMTFSIYNVLGRNNAYSVFFVRPEGTNGLPKAHKFAVLGNALPAVTYNIKF